MYRKGEIEIYLTYHDLPQGLNYAPGGLWKSFMSLAPLVGARSEGCVITRHTLLVMNKTRLRVRSGNFCDIPFSGRPAYPVQCLPEQTQAGLPVATRASSSPIASSSMRQRELWLESALPHLQGQSQDDRYSQKEELMDLRRVLSQHLQSGGKTLLLQYKG